MNVSKALAFVFLTGVALVQPQAVPRAEAADATMSASQVVARVLESDPWGLGGAEVNARAIVTESSGRKRELAFEAKSRRVAPPLAKSMIAFTSPADAAGMKFLQVQKDDGDDERFLYTPELKRSRRIAGNTRGDAFMGTDFTYADLDRRDIRRGTAVMKADETIGRFDCYHLDVLTKNSDSPYGHIEMWVRKDNMVPLKSIMYGKSGAAIKTLVAKEIQRLGGRWFITRSTMTDIATSRTTELLLEHIDPREDIPADQFSIRALEKS